MLSYCGTVNIKEMILGGALMGAAAERAKELRAELRKAETAAKAEAKTERDARREREQQQAIAETDAFREENYEVVAGPHRGYATASTGFNDAIEIGVAEWTTHQTSVTLTREEAQAFAEGILKLVK
jgi:hypothetical protein